MRRSTASILFVLGALLVAPPSGAAETRRVSVDSGGIEANAYSADPILSANGRYVAFASEASNLVPGDGNDRNDVFVHDRKTGEATRVSIGAIGGDPDDASFAAALSASGRYVAFGSYASNLVPGDGNGQIDIFVHDRKAGLTTRVSVDSARGEANDASFGPALSSSGRYVAFTSYGSNLVERDENDQPDAFVHDRKTGLTTRVSVDSAGVEANGRCFGTAISANGRYVLFSSEASNLVPGDENGVEDIFVRDRKTGATTRVSVASDGGEADGESYRHTLSASGRYVAFDSRATNLVPGDENGATDVFVHDRKTGETTRASVDSAGNEADAGGKNARISANGRYVAFSSNSSDLVAGDGNGLYDVFVHDRKTGETASPILLSAGLEGSSQPVLSANGRTVAFQSDGAELVAGDENGAQDIFVHDRR